MARVSATPPPRYRLSRPRLRLISRLLTESPSSVVSGWGSISTNSDEADPADIKPSSWAEFHWVCLFKKNEVDCRKSVGSAAIRPKKDQTM